MRNGNPCTIAWVGRYQRRIEHGVKDTLVGLNLISMGWMSHFTKLFQPQRGQATQARSGPHFLIYPIYVLTLIFLAKLLSHSILVIHIYLTSKLFRKNIYTQPYLFYLAQSISHTFCKTFTYLIVLGYIKTPPVMNHSWEVGCSCV